MRYFLFSLFIFLLGFLATNFQSVAFTQQPTPFIPHVSFAKGKVVQIETAGSPVDIRNEIQKIKVVILDNPNKGKTVTIDYDPQNSQDLKLNVGDEVILTKETSSDGQIRYYVNDKYRLTNIYYFFVFFLVIVIAVVGWKGLGSIVGLCVSMVVIFAYIVPQILAGHDPLTTSLIGGIIILILTTYVAHGISKQTTIALFSTIISLFITYFIATYAVKMTFLTGFGNEEAADLHFGMRTIINLKGLLLGGIIISTLGALNDITTTQSATIFQLAKLHPHMPFKELFSRGFLVGREHAVSITNTLVLAYAGSALAVFIFFLLIHNSIHIG